MGQINIGGANAAVQLQGNDTITTDQTFTFPDAGGELVTVPAGGQVVGYQQGIWTPVFGDGVVNTYTDGENHWSRIGNTVTVMGRMGFNDQRVIDIAVFGRPYDPIPNTGGGSGTSPEFCGSVMTQYFSSSNVPISMYMSSLSINMYASTNNGPYPRLKYSQFPTSNSQFIFTLIYLTGDTTWQPINGATIQ